MTNNDQSTSRPKVLIIVGAASLAATAISSGILWVKSQNITVDNQYDFFLGTLILLAILFASVLANLVMFFVTALGSDKAESTRERVTLLVLCVLHLVVSAYFILGYATGNTFLTN